MKPKGQTSYFLDGLAISILSVGVVTLALIWLSHLTWAGIVGAVCALVIAWAIWRVTDRYL